METLERHIRFASRFNPADLDRGEIAKVKALPEGDKTEHMLGVVIGKVRGISFRNNPNDPTQASIGLLGVFEGVPYNAELPVIQAPMCFLPASVHTIITEAIQEANGLEAPEAMPARGKPVNHRIDQEIPIMFEIGVRHTATPIGFEFVTNQLRKSVESENVLADLRGELVTSGRITGPATPQKALPAPKGKGKKRGGK